MVHDQKPLTGYVNGTGYGGSALYIISPSNAFHEYCKLTDFYALIRTQCFRHVDGVLVLDSEEYIQTDEDGGWSLTDYAKHNSSECMVHFVVNDESAHRGTATGNEKKMPLKYAVSKNSDILIKAKKAFEKSFSEFTRTKNTFSVRAFEFMEAQEWTPLLFTKKTGLNERAYFRIKSGETNYPHIETVLSICIGLNLGSFDRFELLKLAGHGIAKNKREFAYQYIFDSYRINTVDDFNRVYLTLGVEPNPSPPLRYVSGTYEGEEDD